MCTERRRARRVVLAACIASVATSPLLAQRLAGTVTDQGARVPGAVVFLLGQNGNVVARTVTHEAGDFSLGTTTPGAFTVRVLRIGYRPTVAGPFELRAGATTTVEIKATGRIVVLPEVQVNDRSECRVHPDSSAVAFRIWDEARTSLLAAALNESRALGVRMTRSDRMLDRDGTRVVSDSTTTQSGKATHPIVSLAPDSLAKVGYVSYEKDGGATYWGPDANVLLSDSFASTHCIRTERAPADTGALRGVVGVAFEPVKRDEAKVDISGVLWLDRQTAELRTLDYSYVNVPQVVERGHAGGHVEFLRLPDGSWTVSRWWIRYPVISTHMEHVQSEIPGVASTDRARQQVAGFRLSTEDILELRRGEDVFWERGRVSATIRVVDSTSGDGVRGALVSIDGGHSSFATAADGTVRFDRVLPGPATIVVRVPALDSLGAPPVRLPITISDHPFEPIVGRIQSPAAQFASRCGAQAAEWDEAAIRGIVPASHAGGILEVTWQVPFARLGGGAPVVVPEARRVTADSTGAFFLCGVPREVPITLRVLGTKDPSLTRVVQVGAQSLVGVADFNR